MNLSNRREKLHKRDLGVRPSLKNFPERDRLFHNCWVNTELSYKGETERTSQRRGQEHVEEEVPVVCVTPGKEVSVERRQFQRWEMKMKEWTVTEKLRVVGRHTTSSGDFTESFSGGR